jgi:hypothetical protein
MSDERRGDTDPAEGGTPADGDYGFSGRAGFSEGNYSGAYGRGGAGARDNPSASGVEGAGTTRGGNAIPSPDPADGDASEGDEGGGTGRTP